MQANAVVEFYGILYGTNTFQVPVYKCTIYDENDFFKNCIAGSKTFFSQLPLAFLTHVCS